MYNIYTYQANHYGYTGIAAKIVHNILSSKSLHCLNLVNIALILRRSIVQAAYSNMGPTKDNQYDDLIGSGHFVRLR